jgi:hypothetical protein
MIRVSGETLKNSYSGESILLYSLSKVFCTLFNSESTYKNSYRKEPAVHLYSLFKVFCTTWQSESAFKNSYNVRNHSVVLFVQSLLHDLTSWKSIQEFIQVRNHSFVLFVQSLLHDLTSWKHIQEFIQERNHSVVLFVQSLLHNLTSWKNIQEFIQERNHSVVYHVRIPLVIPQLSSSTQKFITGITRQLYGTCRPRKNIERRTWSCWSLFIFAYKINIHVIIHLAVLENLE